MVAVGPGRSITVWWLVPVDRALPLLLGGKPHLLCAFAGSTLDIPILQGCA